MSEKTYVAIDLKSFYASVECMDAGLDPLTTNLVVADESRTAKTICLAVSPSLKSFGVGGRPRLFEVQQKIREINSMRKNYADKGSFTESSTDLVMLKADKNLSVDFIIAKPRMSRYMQISGEIYGIYLKYVSPDDIFPYSVDEVFIDATKYLKLYNCTAREFTMMLIKDVLKSTGVTATAGIGTNMYLCKIAMDIEAKHIKADNYGVRIAELDEMSYRKKLWKHKPITDFWRVGSGTAKKLADNGIFTMGDIARCSIGDSASNRNEELLYKLFGVNAEFLIDHAWGYEPCTIKDVKDYEPECHSLSAGQVLSRAYSYEQALVVLKEMSDTLSYSLLEKNLLTNHITITVVYDGEKAQHYHGATEIDRYGRMVPKSSHSGIYLGEYTSSSKQITDFSVDLFNKIVNKSLFVRRLYFVADNVITQQEYSVLPQTSLFNKNEKAATDKEQIIQKTVSEIRRKYGKNAILKAISYEQAGTARERNQQVGGHKA